MSRVQKYMKEGKKSQRLSTISGHEISHCFRRCLGNQGGNGMAFQGKKTHPQATLGLPERLWAGGSTTLFTSSGFTCGIDLEAPTAKEPFAYIETSAGVFPLCAFDPSTKRLFWLRLSASLHYTLWNTGSGAHNGKHSTSPPAWQAGTVPGAAFPSPTAAPRRRRSARGCRRAGLPSPLCAGPGGRRRAAKPRWMGLRGRGLPAAGLRWGAGWRASPAALPPHASTSHQRGCPRSVHLWAPAAASWQVSSPAAGKTGGVNSAESYLQAAGGGAPRCRHSPGARRSSKAAALRWALPAGGTREATGSESSGHRPIRAHGTRAADLQAPARGSASLLPARPGSHLRRKTRPQPRGQGRGEAAALPAGCGAEGKGRTGRAAPAATSGPPWKDVWLQLLPEGHGAEEKRADQQL